MCRLFIDKNQYDRGELVFKYTYLYIVTLLYIKLSIDLLVVKVTLSQLNAPIYTYTHKHMGAFSCEEVTFMTRRSMLKGYI